MTSEPGMRGRLREQLMRDEGLRLKPYTDTTGHVSIGYGRNLTDVGINETEALLLLDNDLEDAMVALDHALPWAMDLDDVRYAVLANMTFNMGIAGLLKFKATLAAVKRGDWAAAKRGMLASKWAREQVKGRARRLAAQMETGTWQ